MSVQEFEFQEVKFYEYTIRMTNIDNVDMYLVSDLLKQYNEINHTDKRIRDWMKEKIHKIYYNIAERKSMKQMLHGKLI